MYCFLIVILIFDIYTILKAQTEVASSVAEFYIHSVSSVDSRQSAIFFCTRVEIEEINNEYIFMFTTVAKADIGVCTTS